MNKRIAAALMTASVASAGFAGFTVTSALAQGGSTNGTQVVQVQAAEDGTGSTDPTDGEGCAERRAAKAEELAGIIGISVDELSAAREAGQTPAEIAEDNGVAREDLVAALVEARQDHLDEAVADGELTQEEADEKAAELDDRVNAFVDGEHSDHDGDRGPDADTPNADEEGTA